MGGCVNAGAGRSLPRPSSEDVEDVEALLAGAPGDFDVIIGVATWVADMVELKVRKIGNSLGVVLPKEVVSRLSTREGARLFLSEAPDGGYRLSPHDPGFDEKMTRAEDIIGRYRNTLHVLAK
jgi:putative addiction module antidote